MNGVMINVFKTPVVSPTWNHPESYALDFGLYSSLYSELLVHELIDESFDIFPRGVDSDQAALGPSFDQLVALADQFL